MWLSLHWLKAHLLQCQTIKASTLVCPNFFYTDNMTEEHSCQCHWLDARETTETLDKRMLTQFYTASSVWKKQNSKLLSGRNETNSAGASYQEHMCSRKMSNVRGWLGRTKCQISKAWPDPWHRAPSVATIPFLLPSWTETVHWKIQLNGYKVATLHPNISSHKLNCSAERKDLNASVVVHDKASRFNMNWPEWVRQRDVSRAAAWFSGWCRACYQEKNREKKPCLIYRLRSKAQAAWRKPAT